MLENTFPRGPKFSSTEFGDEDLVEDENASQHVIIANRSSRPASAAIGLDDSAPMHGSK